MSNANSTTPMKSHKALKSSIRAGLIEYHELCIHNEIETFCLFAKNFTSILMYCAKLEMKLLILNFSKKILPYILKRELKMEAFGERKMNLLFLFCPEP